MIDVQLADEVDKTDWTEFLRSQSGVHHAFCWPWRRIIRETFGHSPKYLIARGADKAISGVLPLFHVKSVLFGSALVSVPYLNAGGILAMDSASTQALSDAATALAEDLQVDYLELRHRDTEVDEALELVERKHKVSMSLKLAEDPEELFASFKPKLRSQIRRPSKSGITSVVDDSALVSEKDIDAFYQVFAEHMRDLGTPVFPRNFFRLAKRYFGDSCRVITVWHDKRPVAAGITIGFENNTEMLWAASLRAANRMSPNMLLYWDAMKRAIVDNYRVFDFGRSSYDSGPYRFKKQWGATEIPLHWHYRVFNGEIPDINPNSPRFELMVRCWQRMPLVLSNRIGPWITRSLP